MAQVGQVFEAAQSLGDVSSLNTLGSAAERFRSRVIGKAAGKAVGGVNMVLGVFGLLAWAEFFNWLTDQIRIDAAEPRAVGSFASYAAGYELGFENPPGSGIENQPRPFFGPAIQKIQNQFFSGSGPQKPFSLDRSGLYVEGKFLTDLRSVVRGDIPGRVGRRGAGAATSRFFWGALTNPDKNFLETLAKRIAREARKNIEQQGLVDTGALKASMTWAEDIDSLRSKSHRRIASAAAGDPRIDRRFGEL